MGRAAVRGGGGGRAEASHRRQVNMRQNLEAASFEAEAGDNQARLALRAGRGSSLLTQGRAGGKEAEAETRLNGAAPLWGRKASKMKTSRGRQRPGAAGRLRKRRRLQMAAETPTLVERRAGGRRAMPRKKCYVDNGQHPVEEKRRVGAPAKERRGARQGRWHSQRRKPPPRVATGRCPRPPAEQARL